MDIRNGLTWAGGAVVDNYAEFTPVKNLSFTQRTEALDEKFACAVLAETKVNIADSHIKSPNLPARVLAEYLFRYRVTHCLILRMPS